MSVIEKIVRIDLPYYVPILDCKHAGPTSGFKEIAGEIGDERECLACKERSGDEKE